jgi:hypothetical protein
MPTPTINRKKLGVQNVVPITFCILLVLLTVFGLGYSIFAPDHSKEFWSDVSPVISKLIYFSALCFLGSGAKHLISQWQH